MKKFAFAVFIVGLVILYGSFLHNRLKYFGDAVEYFQLSESIRTGKGYTENGGFNSKWPPATPVLLAIGEGLLHANVAGLKMLFGLIGLAGLFIAYLLIKQFYDEQLALWIGILTAVSFPFIYWIVDISTESPYLLFSVVALLCGQISLLQRGRWVFAVVTGIASGFAILTRTVGISLLLGVGLFAAIQILKQKPILLLKSVVVLGIALMICGSWYFYASKQGGVSSVHAYTSYGFRKNMYDPNSQTGFITTLWRIKENILGYAFIWSSPDSSLRLATVSRFTPRGVLSVIIMSLAAVGFFWHFLKKPRLPECYLASYTGILLVFNWYDIRYVVPILPLVFYYLTFTIKTVCSWLMQQAGKPQLERIALLMIMGCLIIGNLGISIASPQAKRLRSPHYDGIAGQTYDAAMWLHEHAPDATVLTRQMMVGFWTHMKIAGLPLLSNPDDMWRYIREHGINYIIYDPDTFSGVTPKYLKPALEAYPKRSIVAVRFGEIVVYRVLEPTQIDGHGTTP